MAAPTYGIPSSSTSASTNTITLTAPGLTEVGFYVVAFAWPGGSTSGDWTPTASPNLAALPPGTYDQRWSTFTQWEQPNFVFAVHGHADLPPLTWTFPSSFDACAVVRVIIENCWFRLRASNITLAADDQLSPAAQETALYSVRGATGVGDTSSAPPTPQVVFAAESGLTPAQAVVPVPSPASTFAAMYPTAVIGPPTVGTDIETFAPTNWSTNSAFFPDVWGSTLSIYAADDNPDLVLGWHTGRIGWA